ncbi:unnamed protein product [Polarella glacialis]|uniref:Uncharacterized protein n=1 Tax=Polarella glacialis TaxID=89957 RepID=A0A813DN97_POLGL|nr:unnamed protein product [Polarella glacialis]|mmetsp:Transcript_64657/g.104550  ORF Transcript_64657/g.104550 Transcript_64657/m.104550 type:complete len:290 (+) Transcript_64657:91-960(+)|eukprot:CAMPEP_0115088656 /NCGR_PEP_ID=MMETSP0227-20121206/24144_1 /TAXON_ID=89957 /ORGANISM="Polarella glacialis, Strain CCMP 1383" /LENGTH=289 /DNA_ID=CAMNT_0002479013 /DNA_START=46 /DNA_END=915 /DNA_ORIENTATION=-
MVILDVKRSEKKNEFLFETTVKSNVGDVVKELCTVHNLRLKVQRLALCLKELAKHGPLRPEETRGISDSISNVTELDVNAYGQPTRPDEQGYRTGCPPPQEVADVLSRTAEEAEAAVSVNLVAQKRTLDQKACQTHIDNMRGAVMIAYPGYHRLPVYDPARQELEDKEELDGASDFQCVLDHYQTNLWWAGKELRTDQTLEQYIGKNEKTKIVAKLAPKSAGAPVREPRIDENTHKAMMSHYYKKQEEQKKLQEDEDDSYLEADWANPKSLKGSLVGGGRPISWKAGGR